MNPDQIQRVRASFALVAPIAPTAASLFYAHLFEADPGLRKLFRGDMTAQGAKLMQMIGAAVGLLDRPDSLLPVLRQLGARHGGYGVVPVHYELVGAALLKTLAQGLGDAFDEPTREAWTAMYGLVAGTMIEAARLQGHEAERLAAVQPA
jgi:hemoglobin-like flavoprotein